MRGEQLRASILAVFVISTSTVLLVPTAPAAIIDPASIPKFVTPLVIPPEMPKTDADAAGDYYEIAVRQFQQQILPAGFPATTVWGYGSVNHPGSFHYPAFTVEATSNRRTTVKWINDLVDAQGNYLPHLLAVDQTLHWANPPQQCADGTMQTDCAGNSQAAYTGPVPVVTHLHGAHVSAESDGYPEAWYLPAASNIPAGYATEGSHYSDVNGGATPGSGYAIFGYANDQPSTTLWFHDHTLGMTRLNVYAGPAGFWLIRERGRLETGLDAGWLPGPAPRVGDLPGRRYYEIPIVIQDRSFNDDGSLFYPQDRAFFEGLQPADLRIPFIGDPQGRPSDIAPIWNPEAFFNVMVVNGKAWPYLDVDRARYRLRLLNGSNARFLNLSLKVISSPNAALVGTEIPVYQIGGDQGLLSDVVAISTGSHVVFDDETGTQQVIATHPQQALLLAPAERADVIVEFNDLPPGTRVRMLNTGPDEPFGAFPVAPADSATTGQVMEFVIGDVARASFTTPSKLRLRDATPLQTVLPPRQLSLIEEDSSQVCVRVLEDGSVEAIPTVQPGPSFLDDCTLAGGMPFGPKAAKLGTVSYVNGLPVATPFSWIDPITEKPLLGATEEWEIHNTTVDAHPIHLHQVKFQVVGRQPMMGMSEMNEIMTPMTGLGLLLPPEPNETGWKDTVIAYPGMVTRVRATFDLPGLYVWHCHIVEHEDNEMMRSLCVDDPANPGACPGGV